MVRKKEVGSTFLMLALVIVIIGFLSVLALQGKVLTGRMVAEIPSPETLGVEDGALGNLITSAAELNVTEEADNISIETGSNIGVEGGLGVEDLGIMAAPVIASANITSNQTPVYSNSTLIGWCNASDADADLLSYDSKWFKNNVLYEENVPQSISADVYHTCGIITNGTAYCWGDNTLGQLGNGGVAQQNNPVAVNISSTFKSISVGGYVGGILETSHTCSILTNGSAMCWGFNSNGQLGDGTTTQKNNPVAVNISSTFKSISAGASGYHSCGILTNGSAYCWGYGGQGRLGYGGTTDQNNPIAVNISSTFKSISAGNSHSCGILTNGSAYCWGYGSNGRLGYGGTTDQLNPVAVNISSTFKSISAGYQYSCGILTNGSAMCWGFNSNGQLGDGGVAQQNNPVAVNISSTFKSISVGYQYSCGVLTNGSAMCWGRSNYGQLGYGGTAQQNNPITVNSTSTMYPLFTQSILTNVFNITYGLTAGDVWNLECTAWDATTSSAALNSSAITITYGPSPPVLNTATLVSNESNTSVAYSTSILIGSCNASDANGDNVSYDAKWYKNDVLYEEPIPDYIEAGGFHTCGLLTNGSAYCWGDGSFGKLGYSGESVQYNPIAVNISSAFKSVSAGEYNTCGILTNGTAYCWGTGTSGQLGYGGLNHQYNPKAVNITFTFRSISVSAGFHTCGVLTNGSAYCWGNSANGALGYGGTSQQNNPITVNISSTFKSITTGQYHACGLLTNGSAYCWGFGGNGQLGNGGTGQQNNPVPVNISSTFKSISAGYSHTCGLLTNGSAYCWGYGDYGQLGYGGTTSQNNPITVNFSSIFKSISAGYRHTCGLLTNGSAYCWGRGAEGQLGYGGTTQQNNPIAVNTSSTFKFISAGNPYTCGILTNGSAYCWGGGISGIDNTGQLGYGGTTQQNNPIVVNSTSTMYPLFTQGVLTNAWNITFGLVKNNNWTLECTAWDATTASSALNSSTITILNTAPMFDQSLTSQTINSSSTLTYDINCSDLDSDTLTYFDNTSLFNINSSTGIIIDTPSHLEHGSHNITITCGDGQDNTTSTFIYTINDIESPTITIEGPLIPTSNVTLNLTTNEAANCSYGTTSGNYTLMNSTSNLIHLQNLTSLTAGLKRYYFQCNDTSGNSATTNFTFLVTSTTSERSAVTKINATANTLVSTKPTTNVNLTFNLSSTSANISVAVAEFNTSPEASSLTVSGSTTAIIKYITIEAPAIVDAINKITIKIDYNETEVAAAGIAEADLLVYYYNSTSGNWQLELESAVNIVSNYVEVNVTHLSTFVLGKATATVAATTATSSSSNGGGNCAPGYKLVSGKCVKPAAATEEKPASETEIVSAEQPRIEVPRTDQPAASQTAASIAPEWSTSFIGRMFSLVMNSGTLKSTGLILLVIIIIATTGLTVYRRRGSKPKKKEKFRELKVIPKDFVSQLEEFLSELRINIEQKEVVCKDKETNCIVKVPSPVGAITYFCKAMNKPLCDEKDLSSAYMEAKFKKLPLLFVYPDELHKKARKMLASGIFENAIVKKIE